MPSVGAQWGPSNPFRLFDPEISVDRAPSPGVRCATSGGLVVTHHVLFRILSYLYTVTVKEGPTS